MSLSPQTDPQHHGTPSASTDTPDPAAIPTNTPIKTSVQNLGLNPKHADHYRRAINKETDAYYREMSLHDFFSISLPAMPTVVLRTWDKAVKAGDFKEVPLIGSGREHEMYKPLVSNHAWLSVLKPLTLRIQCDTFNNMFKMCGLAYAMKETGDHPETRRNLELDLLLDMKPDLKPDLSLYKVSDSKPAPYAIASVSCGAYCLGAYRVFDRGQV